jgi:hypothetical protein
MIWSWRTAPLLALGCVLLAVPARAAGKPGPQDPAGGGWELYEEEGGCIGGSRCGDQGDAIRIPLEDAAVLGVRFHAHDDVGESRGGHLRIRIDGFTVAGDLAVAQGGDTYELPVPHRRGHSLVIETRTDEEVVVEDIEIRYGGLQTPRERREWRAYSDQSSCIGGDRCRDEGTAIRIPLEDAPVWGVRFHAHDNIGERTKGHLRVRIDRRTLARDIDVPRDGQIYNLQVDGVQGRYLVLEAIAQDEVVVEDIEVQYSGLKAPWEPRGAKPQ